jgi:hypothetical protein
MSESGGRASGEGRGRLEGQRGRNLGGADNSEVGGNCSVSDLFVANVFASDVRPQRLLLFVLNLRLEGLTKLLNIADRN